MNNTNSFFGSKFVNREDKARTRKKGIIIELIDKLKKFSNFHLEQIKEINNDKKIDKVNQNALILYHNNLSFVYIAMTHWLNKV